MNGRDFWIRGLRAVCNIVFVGLVFGGFFGGIAMGSAIGGFGGFLMFLIFTACGFVVAYLSVAVMMIFLGIAEDMSYVAGKMGKEGEYISSEKNTYVDPFAEAKNKFHETQILKNGGWKCENCGNVNSLTTGTCGCGHDRYQATVGIPPKML